MYTFGFCENLAIFYFRNIFNFFLKISSYTRDPKSPGNVTKNCLTPCRLTLRKVMFLTNISAKTNFSAKHHFRLFIRDWEGFNSWKKYSKSQHLMSIIESLATAQFYFTVYLVYWSKYFLIPSTKKWHMDLDRSCQWGQLW